MRRLGRDQRRDLISEYEGGELEQKEFAAKHDVSISTLQYYLYKFRKESSIRSSESRAAFLPIEVVADALPRRRTPPSGQQRQRGFAAGACARKNFLFVDHDEGGEHLAGLYALVATCEANGVNPQAYLADVLLRVQTHPASDIDQLLPHNWSPRVPASDSG